MINGTSWMEIGDDISIAACLSDWTVSTCQRPSQISCDVHAPANASPGEQTSLTFPKERPRRWSKDHLPFIRSQVCLVCQKTPADAHHLKFAQPRTLGRKVSDECTEPLCRAHHQSLHRHGDERAWWTNLQISPRPIAKQRWDGSPVDLANGATVAAPPSRPQGQ